MSLTELWVNSRQQLEGKTIQQIIAFAGEGHLRDRSVASALSSVRFTLVSSLDAHIGLFHENGRVPSY